MAKSLTLAVNGWRLQAFRTGVARYLLNILRHWTRDNVAERFSAIHLYTAEPLREVSLPATIHNIVLRSTKPLLVWENTHLAFAAREDMLFCPSYSIPVLRGKRSVVAIHDAALHLYPERFPRRARIVHDRLYGWSGRHASLVITDSQAGADDIVSSYGVPRSRIRVIPLAHEEIFRRNSDPDSLARVRARFLGGDFPFFLFVGKLSGRRNVPLLLEAFARFNARSGNTHRLLVVGANVHDLPLETLIDQLSLTGQVIHCPRVEDDELVLLYNAAQAFISPSVYETVCLPVLEAQACGTPVICIDTNGMREQTGGAALLIPELEVDVLSAAMRSLAEDTARRDDFSRRGLVNAGRFSWKSSSLETLDVLAEAASTRRARPD